MEPHTEIPVFRYFLGGSQAFWMFPVGCEIVYPKVLGSLPLENYHLQMGCGFPFWLDILMIQPHGTITG